MDIRYPIGQFSHSGPVTREHIDNWIDELEKAPSSLQAVLDDLSGEQLDTPYREGGWTPRQITHHITDSNLNMYTRFKLALTEDNPKVKTYNESLWSQLIDARESPVEDSLRLLEGLHSRWVFLLRHMSDDDFNRFFVHPDAGDMPLGYGVGVYSWHTRHHIAQVAGLRDRMGW